MASDPSQGRAKTWSFDAFVVGIATAGTGRHFAVGLGDGTLRILDTADPAPSPITVHKGACLSLCADVDADAFLSGGDDGRLVRVSLSGEQQALIETKGKWIEHVAAHAGSGVRVYASGKDAFLLDRKGKAEPRRLSHATSVGGLAINPKGRRLAATHYNGVSLWWLAAHDSKPQVLEWKGSHLGAAWSPDGDYVITIMQENALHGWRLSDAQHMRMQGYGAKVRSISFMRKGQFLATGGADTVICWPFTGGGPMGKAPAEFGGGVAGAGAGSPVTAVACNPKADLIAAGFENGAVILGQPGAPRSVTVAGARKAPVTAMAWNGAGDMLLVGDEAGDVMLADFRG
jgi:WD40 repeat protein